MSDSVRPHRWQPTRPPRPWDSPGKNTGMGCHFLLQCMKVKSESEVAQLCPTLSDPMDLQPTRLLRPWDSPGKSTGMGCHCLLRPNPLPLFKTEQSSPGNLRQYFRYGSQVLVCLSPQNTLNCILCKEITDLKVL